MEAWKSKKMALLSVSGEGLLAASYHGGGHVVRQSKYASSGLMLATNATMGAHPHDFM